MGQLSGSLSAVDRYNLALQAGFNSSNAIIMAAISMFECANCDMSRQNASGDVGLWQINKVHWSELGLSQAQLADPLTNAKAAFKIWSGQGFRGWCTYPGGCNLTPGTQGQPTWSEFNAKVAQVTGALAGAGITADTPASPILSGSGPVLGDGTASDTTTAGTQPNSGVNAGSIGPFPINVPTGMVLALIAVLLIIVGAIMLLAQNPDVQAVNSQMTRQAVRAAVEG